MREESESIGSESESKGVVKEGVCGTSGSKGVVFDGKKGFFGSDFEGSTYRQGFL